MGSVVDSVRRWEAWKRGELEKSILLRYETAGEVPQSVLAGLLDTKTDFSHKG